MIHAAILWKWPGAQVIVRGGVLERWDGPMPRPSDAEIAQAVIDYAAVADHVTADAATDALLDAVDGDFITALLEQWPAMVAAAQAGTFNKSVVKQTLRSRMKVLRRAKPSA